MSVALILAGHGSHVSPNTAGVVWCYVDALRRWGVADEITACFWKEQPHFHQVLRTVKSDTIVVVPLFTAAGFFSQQVIPAEMGLSPTQAPDPHPPSPEFGGGVAPATEGVLGVVHDSEQTIFYTRVLGEHPYLETIVQQRVCDAMRQAHLSPEYTAVVVIGHGTSRSESTRETTRQQVRRIQAARLAHDVIDAYLDDDPHIASIYERTTAQHLVVVPFFLAPGSHTTQDVPQALGIQYGDYPAQVQGRQVYYTPPVGSDDAICNLILQLARDTGLSFVEHPSSDKWSGMPQAGADEMLSAFAPGDKFTFGQLQITQDAVQPIHSIQKISFDNPADLRRHVRENPFRSMATAANLPCDWVVQVDLPEQIPAVVETVYPGAMADWAAQRRGELKVENLSDVIAQQQGMFKTIVAVDEVLISQHVSGVCGRCIKHPTWHTGQTPSDRVLCSAPCNHWLTQIKENMIHEG